MLSTVTNIKKYFQAGQDFRGWQEHNQICYFPDQKNLTYFKTYSQNNCLLECRVKKISLQCGCAPWFIPRNKATNSNSETNEERSINNIPTCTREGIDCFEAKSKVYKEDLKDREECDCRNDCEMVHIFSSLKVNMLAWKYFM